MSTNPEDQAVPPFARPNRESYVVPGARLAAGAYPGTFRGDPATDIDAKLRAFLAAGITAFVDLTDPADPLIDYAPRLRELAAEQDVDVVYDRMTIRDMDVCARAHMRAVLDLIDARLAEGRSVYVHCWGGIGRTGMVVGCWLVRHGATGERALRCVAKLYSSTESGSAPPHRRPRSPQTDAQREMVWGWSSSDKP